MRITPTQALERLMSQEGTGMAKARAAKGTATKPLALLQSVRTYSKDRLFVFGQGGTAIVTPADDSIQPVVAEFETNDEGVINPAAQLMLDDYAREVRAVQEGGDGMVSAEPEERQYADVAPMMAEIYWHQHEPFNDLLEFVEVKPTKGLVEKCIVGCPATAVSQLLYYFAKKGRERGCETAPAYTSKRTTTPAYTFTIPSEAARVTFDYANMLDVYTRRSGSKYVKVGSYTDEQANAAAELCCHVAKALKIMFSPTSSGQYPSNVTKALPMFHLGTATEYAQPRESDQYNTLYLDKVHESLERGVPVMIGAYTGTAASADGHFFLIDGYRSKDDTFHVNWGWGKGFNNGWFKMSRLKYSEAVSGFDFSFRKTFIILDDYPTIFMDVNGDGRINMSDVGKVISNIGKDNPEMDVNYDGKVDGEDAQMITNKILGKK